MTTDATPGAAGLAAVLADLDARAGDLGEGMVRADCAAAQLRPLVADGSATAFTCPRCGRTSHHPQDVEHGYCGACHDFTAVPGLAAVLAELVHRAGGVVYADWVADQVHAALDGDPGWR